MRRGESRGAKRGEGLAGIPMWRAECLAGVCGGKRGEGIKGICGVQRGEQMCTEGRGYSRHMWCAEGRAGVPMWRSEGRESYVVRRGEGRIMQCAEGESRRM